MFKLDSLRADAFSWQTALSLAFASNLSYERAETISQRRDQQLGFQHLQVPQCRGYAGLHRQDGRPDADRFPRHGKPRRLDHRSERVQRPVAAVRVCAFGVPQSLRVRAADHCERRCGARSGPETLDHRPQPGRRAGDDRGGGAQGHDRHPGRAHLRPAAAGGRAGPAVLRAAFRRPLLPFRQRRRPGDAHSAGIRACRPPRALRRAG